MTEPTTSGQPEPENVDTPAEAADRPADFPQDAPPAPATAPETTPGAFTLPAVFPAGQFAPGHFPAGQYAPASTSGIPYSVSAAPDPTGPTRGAYEPAPTAYEPTAIAYESVPSAYDPGSNAYEPTPTSQFSPGQNPYSVPEPYQPQVSGPGYWPAAPTDAVPPPPLTPRKKRRYGLIISLVVVVLIVLCGGVGTAAYVVSSRQTGTGSDTPVNAASGFLTAIYQHQNATAAADYVCKQANDASALKKKVAEVTKATDELDDPTYSWSTLQVANQTTKEATITTDLTISTDDEKRSTQHLEILTVNANGWWVCDVKASTR